MFIEQTASPSQRTVVTTSTQLWSSPSPNKNHSENNKAPSPSSFVLATSFIGVLILIASTVTLWSEWTVFQTGCGPLTLSDVLERTCYEIVLVTFSALWFARIAFQQDLMASFYENNLDRIQPPIESQASMTKTFDERNKNADADGPSSPLFLLLRSVEISTYLCMADAIFVLLNQANNNVDLVNAGLSGIDENMCRAKLGFFQEQQRMTTTTTTPN